MEKKTYVIVYGHEEFRYGTCLIERNFSVDGMRVVDAYDMQDAIDVFNKSREYSSKMLMRLYRIDEFMNLIEGAMAYEDREKGREKSSKSEDERMSNIENRISRIESFLSNALRKLASKCKFEQFEC